MKNFLILSLVFLQSLTAAHASRLPSPVHIPSEQSMSSPDYIVIDIVIAGYQASWPATTGSGNYNLTVVDMATGQTHCSVSTPDTSTIITGLRTGSYKFTLSRGATIIIEEVIGIQ